MKKYLIALFRVVLLLLVAAASAGGYLYYQAYQANQQRAQQTAALRTEVIVRGNIVSKVSATGALLPAQQVSAYFWQPGLVTEVLVASGDAVLAGQVMARLDAANLKLAVQQAEDAVAIAELNRQKLLAGPTEGDLTVAKANLRSAQAAVADLLRGAGPEQVNIAQIKYADLQETARRTAEQYDALLKFAQDNPRFAPPQDQLDAFKLQLDAANYAAELGRVQLAQAKQGADKGTLSVAYAQVVQAQAVLSQTLAPPPAWQVARADQAIEQAQTALQQAELRLTRAELLAPCTCVVAGVNIRAGELASVAMPAIIVLDASRFHLDVMVDEIDVVKLAAGQLMSITLDALPGVVVGGQVERIAPVATVAAGVVNYQVRLALNPTGSETPLRAGMSATAEIVVAQTNGVVLAPNWAIRRDRRTGLAYASLLVGEQLTEVAITTGLRGDTHTEVRSGATTGDVAAVASAGGLPDLLGGK